MAGKVSQEQIEAAVRANPTVRVSTLALEVVRTTASASIHAQVSQLVIEVARLVRAQAAVAQTVIEVAYLALPPTGRRRRPIGGWVG